MSNWYLRYKDPNTLVGLHAYSLEYDVLVEISAASMMGRWPE